MRQLASLLLLACVAHAAVAAEVWRWKDADGVTHISDRPMPGAERVTVTAPRAGAAAPMPQSSTDTTATAEPSARPYLRCVVTSPAQEAAFQRVDPITVSLQLDPALQAGHRITVLLNGAPVTDWPPGSAAHTLTDLFRGSYTLTARVVDDAGRALCSSPSITFHVRQPSLLSPARRPTSR